MLAPDESPAQRLGSSPCLLPKSRRGARRLPAPRENSRVCLRAQTGQTPGPVTPLSSLLLFLTTVGHSAQARPLNTLLHSTGYFIHDTLDIIFNHQSRSSWEYLVHHAMAISAFTSLIITGRFLVAAMLLLLVEVSNIFLTIRMLLKMSNVPSPALYEANKYLNLVIYFAFRLAPQAYLTWYFLRYVEVQGQGAFLTANLLLLDAMILMYFSRLLRSDFFPSLHKGAAGRDVDGEKFLID
ncbi:Calfacilitin [Willisornis vidua]|uniref:Calfacilitin n=1 Tax=Willisornis vidua TaxID=1566151 RepID=A0ABQ9DDE3_9PASS|nr:Calfacilitin [Willisornis vidua]